MKNMVYSKINDDNYDTHRENLRKYLKLQMSGKSALPYILQDFMDKYGKTPSQVYKAAFLERQVFDRLLNFANPQRGSKRTLLQAAIGMGLDREETDILLASCGHSLEPTSKVDGIFAYAIDHEMDMWDVYDLAEMANVELDTRKSRCGKTKE